MTRKLEQELQRAAAEVRDALERVEQAEDFADGVDAIGAWEEAARAYAAAAGRWIDRFDKMVTLFQSAPLPEAKLALERERIVSALRRFDGDKGRAAEELGIAYPTLTKKCRDYGI